MISLRTLLVAAVAATTLALGACNTTGNADVAAKAPAISGPAVEFTPPPIGSTYVILDDTYKVVSHEGVNYTMELPNGRDVTLVGGLFPSWNIERRTFDMDAIKSLWPLQVGKTARSRVSQRVGGVYWTLDFTVLRREPVTVPAGTFDAYVVEMVETSSTNRYKGRNLYWYAPDVRTVVKRDFTFVKGNGASKDFELQSYDLKS